MIALAISERPLSTYTSAAGSMFRAGPVVHEAMGVFVVTGLSAPATGSTYNLHVPFERTAAGSVGQVDAVPAETSGETILEIRRRSGLTWEELGDLFNVSRRSVHHWASGKAVSAKHDQLIRQMLAAIRHLDRGEAARTRALLLTMDAKGIAVLDLLKAGLFEEAMGRADGRPAAEQHRTPLSQAAQDMRRPPAQALLLEASQERPDIPAKARIARAVRAPKATG